MGINLLTGKIRAGDKPSSYEDPLGMDCAWSGLNIEQQAMVVEHRLSDLPELANRILEGKVKGRVVVDVNA